MYIIIIVNNKSSNKIILVTIVVFIHFVISINNTNIQYYELNSSRQSAVNTN